MVKYKKITRDEVLSYMTNNELTADWFQIFFTAKLLAKSLGTSYYQANKYLRQLHQEGFIKYETMPSMCSCYSYQSFCECEPHIPINGYLLTEKAKEKKKDEN